MSAQSSPVLSIKDLDESKTPPSYSDSIAGDDEGYQTSPSDCSYEGASASPELNSVEVERTDSTPRAPSLRSIAAPLQQFIPECVLTPKSKLDHTLSHLRLCFSNESESSQTALPATGEILTAASAQATPTKNTNHACLVQ
jgi:hypothetical protein